MKNNAMVVKIGVWVIGIAFAAGSVYAVVHYRLNSVEGDVEACEKTAIENKVELVGVKKDIGYLSEKVDRSYDVQKQILDEIKLLHR